MPKQKLKLMPGVDLQSTPTLNQTMWAVSQLIRFYKGLLQKIGGWSHFSSTPVIGTCRALLGWADLSGIPYVATGTEQRLQVLIGGSTIDITPIQQTTNPAVSFSTTSTSATVSITDSYAPSAGDWINLITPVSVGGIVLSGFYQVAVGGTTYTIVAAAAATSTVSNGGAVPVFATTAYSPTVTVTLANHGLTASTSSFNVPLSVSVGGVTLLGTYVVASVVDSSHFTITARTTAASTASASLNSGNAQIQYLLPSGNAVNEALVGYGIGNYGAGYYGEPNSSSSVSLMRIWSLDHFGQDLVASPSGGQIYYWSPLTPTAPAVVVSNTAPTENNWIFVVPAVQILMALGTKDQYGNYSPLLARWCDASDFTDWTPTVSNQAGSFQLSSGSKLVFGAANGLTLYLWTDLGVWTVTYQGLPYIFSFQEMARECGAISPNAVAIFSQGAAWLSVQGFFQLGSSGIVPMECPVWDFYTNNVLTFQNTAITSALNTEFHEISWFFPTATGTAYVKWNWIENVWDYGTLTRTAWIDASPAGGPLGVDANGLIQQHEVGNDADGTPIVASATTGYFDVADGDDFVFVDMIIPDFVASQGATVALTVLSQDYPDAQVTQDGAYLMQPNPSTGNTLPVNFTTTNTRGRQVALQIASSDAGSAWRLGALRYQFRPDGKL